MGASTSTRWLIVIAIAVVTLIVASAAVALAAGLGETRFPADTPEGTVQRYLEAIIDRDAETAIGLLDPALVERCEQAEYRQNLREVLRFPRERRIRATLRDTRTVGAETEVTVSIAESWGRTDPFSSRDYSFDQVFVLRQIEGQWRFVEPPWPIWGCPEPPRPAPAG